MKDLTERKTVYLDDAIEALKEYFARIGKLKRGGLTIEERAIKLDTLDAIKALPSAQPERKSRQQFEKSMHDMFDHIWDTEIDHPVFQDTVGELMEAVLRAFDNAQPEIIRCKNCIHLGHAYKTPCKNCRRNQMLPDWYEVETKRRKDG